MERAVLVMGLIVVLVAVIGVFSKLDFQLEGTMTGNVVAESPNSVVVADSSYDCNSCIGYKPVCARRNHRLMTYDNACEANCDNAKVIYNQPCLAIPVANN